MIGRLAAYNRLALDVDVTLIGLGSIGAALLTQLTYLHRALDQTSGRQLSVTVIDNNTVTERHLDEIYLPAHLLGRPLAAALVSRVNLACGLNWKGLTHLSDERPPPTRGFTPKKLHVLISAQNGAAARLATAKMLGRGLTADLWLDLGHDGLQGQAVLGWTEPAWKSNTNTGNTADRPLPTVNELLGQALIDAEHAESAAEPTAQGSATDGSCADLIAVLGGRLLWSALQPEVLTHHAYFVDLAHGAINSQAVAPLPAPAPAQKTRKKPSASKKAGTKATQGTKKKPKKRTTPNPAVAAN